MKRREKIIPGFNEEDLEHLALMEIKEEALERYPEKPTPREIKRVNYR